jgi:hypothetical protein
VFIHRTAPSPHLELYPRADVHLLVDQVHRHGPSHQACHEERHGGEARSPHHDSDSDRTPANLCLTAFKHQLSGTTRQLRDVGSSQACDRYILTASLTRGVPARLAPRQASNTTVFVAWTLQVAPMLKITVGPGPEELDKVREVLEVLKEGGVEVEQLEVSRT